MPSSIKPKMQRTKKHHREVLRVLREVLADETWKSVMGDVKLAQKIRDKGTFASHTIVISVRKAANIGDAYERKVALFSQAMGRGK